MIDLQILFVYAHIAFIVFIDYILFDLKDKDKISSEIFYILQVILFIFISIGFYIIINNIK